MAPAQPPLLIVVLGAKGTEKTALAAALAQRLADETGLRCGSGPPPIDAAALACELFVCATDEPVPASPSPALQVAQTLLLALDPRRHDPAAEATETALRAQLQAAGGPWMLIAGQGAARLEAAIDALAPLLRARTVPRAGLLTRLAQRNAAAPRWHWVCENCDVPECEHAQRFSSTHPRRAADPPAE